MQNTPFSFASSCNALPRGVEFKARSTVQYNKHCHPLLSKGVPKHPQKQYNAKAAKKLDYHKLSIRLTSVGALVKVQVTIAAILHSTF